MNEASKGPGGKPPGSKAARHSGSGGQSAVVETPATPPPRPSALQRAPAPVVGPIVEIGAYGRLARQIIWSAVRYPRGYWRAVKDEMYDVLRMTWFPLVLSVVTFGLMTALLGLNFTQMLGSNNRYAEYFFTFNIREFTVWINSLVVAGIIGAAICSDLGARKVREELDALRVLGSDPVHELVLARVVTATIMTPLLALVSELIALVTSVAGSIWYGAVPAGAVYATIFSNFSSIDLTAMLVKSLLIGFVIGLVCSYKGLNSSGGAMGVGRAVNHAVVIAFVLVFLIDLVFNMILLGWFPEVEVMR